MKSPTLWLAAIAAAALVPSTQAGAENAAGPGAVVAAVVLNVADIDKSVAYYKLLGLHDKEHLGQKPNRRVQFNMDAPKAEFAGGLSLHESAGPVTIGSGFIRFLVQVDDAVAACKRLADAGFGCIRPPRAVAEDGNAIIATAKDPDGYELQLIQRPR